MDFDIHIDHQRDIQLHNVRLALYQRRYSVEMVLDLVDNSYDGMHFLAHFVDDTDSVFGYCCRMFTTRKLRTLLTALQTRQPDVMSWKLGDEKETLLHLATKTKLSFHCLRIVADKTLDKAQLLSEDANGDLPLHNACSNLPLRMESLQLLLDPQLHCLRRQNALGMLPLHCAFLGVCRTNRFRREHVKILYWLLDLFRDGLWASDRTGNTPLMAGLQACCSHPNGNWRVPDPILSLLCRLIRDVPTTLSTTNAVSGSATRNALHAMCSYRPKSILMQMVLSNNSELASRVNSKGELPLHCICRIFSQAAEDNEILQGVVLLLDAFPAAVRYRCYQRNLSPVLYAIISGVITPPIPDVVRVRLVHMIHFSGRCSIREQRHHTVRSPSGLKLAYQHWPDPSLVAALIEVSPMDILFIDTAEVPTNLRLDFERQKDRIFLALLELLLHSTTVRSVGTALQTAVRGQVAAHFPGLSTKGAAIIVHTFSQEPVAFDLHLLRHQILARHDVHGLLFQDLSRSNGHLSGMVRGLHRMNLHGRLQTSVEHTTNETHYSMLASTGGNVSSVFLYLHDCVTRSGQLPLNLTKNNEL
jgi:hypothetical protein